MLAFLSLALLAEATFGTAGAYVDGFRLYRDPQACTLSMVLPSGAQAIFQIAVADRGWVTFALLNSAWLSLNPGEKIPALVELGGFKAYETYLLSSKIQGINALGIKYPYKVMAQAFAGGGVLVQAKGATLGIVRTNGTRALAQLTECAGGVFDPFSK